MRQAARLLALSCLIALLGCSHDDPTQVPTGLQERMDSSLGGDLPLVKSATGPMDLKLASRATAVPEGLLQSELRRHGFQGGYSRVWRRGTDVLTVLGYHFFADSDADSFVQFSDDTLSSSRFYTRAQDPLVPGSRAFSLVSKLGSTTTFCSAEYFAVDRDAFVITRCASYPVPNQDVATLAQRQLVRAVTATASP